MWATRGRLGLVLQAQTCFTSVNMFLSPLLTSGTDLLPLSSMESLAQAFNLIKAKVGCITQSTSHLQLIHHPKHRNKRNQSIKQKVPFEAFLLRVFVSCT